MKPTRRENFNAHRLYAKSDEEVTARTGLTYPKARAKPQHHEARDQMAVIHWWDKWCFTQGYDPRRLFMIPNGSGLSGGFTSNMKRMGRLKAMGLRAGVPDLFLTVPKRDQLGLFVEMKSLEGYVRDDQEDYHDVLRAAGYAVAVCYGAEQGIDTIRSYVES